METKVSTELLQQSLQTLFGLSEEGLQLAHETFMPVFNRHRKNVLAAKALDTDLDSADATAYALAMLCVHNVQLDSTAKAVMVFGAFMSFLLSAAKATGMEYVDVDKARVCFLHALEEGLICS